MECRVSRRGVQPRLCGDLEPAVCRGAVGGVVPSPSRASAPAHRRKPVSWKPRGGRRPTAPCTGAPASWRRSSGSVTCGAPSCARDRPVRRPACARTSAWPHRLACVGCPRQHFGLDSIGHFIALAPRVTGEQPRQPIRGNALAPASDVAVTALELGANLRSGQSLGPQQNQAGLSSLIGASLPCPRLPLQFHAFACGQFHHALQRPDDTPIYTLQATSLHYSRPMTKSHL